MSKILYEQIADRIMVNILDEGYLPGDKYKSVREIAVLFTVNPKTVQRAFDHLNKIGIFETVVGDGRYLSANNDVIKQIHDHLIVSEVENFIEKMQSYNLTNEQIKTYLNNRLD